tara:strand:- start:1272 stop:1925 length:654 start_codon:yes stop_codon:yes gene_type:complete
MAMDPMTQKLLIELGIGAAEGGFNFIQAAKTANIQRQAELDAQRYVEDAIKQAKINAEKMRSVSDEPFKLESETISQNLATALENFGGDYRTALSAGGILGQQFAQQQRQASVRRMKQIQDLEADIAGEEQNVAKRLQTIAEERAKGAQQVAAQSEMLATQQRQAGVESIGGMAEDFIDYKYKEDAPSSFSFGGGTFELKDTTKAYDPITNPYVYKP